MKCALVFRHKFVKFRTAVAVGFLLLLSACDSGTAVLGAASPQTSTEPGSETDSAQQSQGGTQWPKIALYGNVIKGPAACVITVEDMSGRALASSQSQSNGAYELVFDGETNAIGLIASNCRYTDETTGELVEGVTLRAGVDLSEVSGVNTNTEHRVKVNVTPFSDVAYTAALQSFSASGEVVTADVLSRFNTAVSHLLDGPEFNLLSDDPILASQTGAYEADVGTGIERHQRAVKFGLYLAAFSGTGEVANNISLLAAELDEKSPTFGNQTADTLIRGASAFDLSGRNTQGLSAVSMVTAETNKRKRITPLTSTDKHGPDNSNTPAASPNTESAQISRVILSVRNGTGSGTYDVGRDQTLIISANDIPGKVFVGWQGDTQFLVNPNASIAEINWPNVDTQVNLEAQYERVATLNKLSTKDAVSRFLTRAGFGASQDDLETWEGLDAADWLVNEFAKAPELLLSQTKTDLEATQNNNAPFSRYASYNLTRQLIESDAQLRVKMTYALSQILVVGGDVVNNGKTTIRGMNYHDVLQKHAFGNYRVLLEEITYQPAMASWLTYLRSSKANQDTGAEPDENFAREILQLFTLGLFELDSGGRLRLGSDGKAISIYDNDDVAQLARVFTGFSYDDTQYKLNYNKNRSVSHLPLKIFDEHHSEREKVFLNAYIPENTSGEASVSLALDEIFSHSTVAPFITRQLIQRFTDSHPSPEYIERVSQAFDEGRFLSANGTSFGDGDRGNLQATLAAILLDESQFVESPAAEIQGKVREPLLKFIHFMRAFNVENLEFITRTGRIKDLTSVDSLGMAYFESPSVFNFYRPGYVPPLTQAGAMGLTVPEFQIADSSSFYGFIGLMTDFILERPLVRNCSDIANLDSNYQGLEPCNFANGEQPFRPNYDQEVALAANPTLLVDHLNTLLLGGRMAVDVRQEITDVISLIPLEPGSYDTNLRDRVRVAVLMFATAPTYTVIW